jgi:flagellar hook-associated protein 3 FlgL
MLTNLDASNAQFLSSVNAIQRRMDKAQYQISSGRRINTVSDDPDQVSSLLAARASLASVQQSTANLGRVQTEVNAAEKGLQQASQVVERIRVLGTQGANTTQTPLTRATIAMEVGALMEQLVGISRTSVEGRYIFSGDLDLSAPFSIDLNQNPAISAYTGGSTNTRQIQHPNGSRFGLSQTAQEVFDSPDPASNVFQAVSDVRNALLASDETAISAALNRLTTAAPHLERMVAYYGTAQNKVAEALEYGRKAELDLKQEIASIEDTDLTEAILELQQAQTQQQAALQSRAQMQRKSLFDFIS